ncbi:hypothetical protein [Dyadobacter fermentans]|uniref:Transmembrane protein n=1 Tax=Dyadobacter fermentans (strain ATCC 700827 / DSM 18053 / CIP 107007 / KCTC 52180 / NS114) TaxID=471854 RepID=C6VZU6_DYAFD|nr:hypothetical protein [Dyadobacter fermentans]ACT93574.1 hypothetical protein Dfer_2355 [Dyadobacter fermentans DSM 18053]
MKPDTKSILRKELRVMFHKDSQKPGVRIVKYLSLSILILVFWRSWLFWWIMAGLALSAVLLHSFYRYKTRGWTRSYGKGIFRWDYEKVFHAHQ